MATSETQQIIDHMQTALSALSVDLAQPTTEQKRNEIMNVVQAGFGALEAAIMPPAVLLCRIALQHELPFAMCTVVDLGLPELLTEGGEKGMSSVEIETRSGLPEAKASRLLRVLTGRGIFRETKPNVWAHTLLSRELDSGLSYAEVAANPEDRYAKGKPMPAWLLICGQYAARASMAMITAFREDRWKKTYKSNEAPFQVAFNTELSFYEYLEANGKTLAFGKAMETNSSRTDLSRFPWADFGENAVVVDVGGGVGSASRDILATAPNVTKAIIQDLPHVLEGAKKFWSEENPTALAEGRVELQAHDFMTPQPVKGAAAYFMRYITHNWSDEDCTKIFKLLHDAAGPNSRMLIMDAVVDHACHDLSDVSEGAVEGAYEPGMPAPLPANGGRAVEVDSFLDILMMGFFNGQERTHLQLKRVAEAAGWKPKKVHRLDARKIKITEFVKA